MAVATGNGLPAPGPPPAPAGESTTIKSYKVKYQEAEDALSGRYQEFYQTRSPDGNLTADQLFERATSTNNRIPKVYMYLTRVQGTPVISTFHRPWKYQQDEIDSTPWDDTTFGFLGDVDSDEGNLFIATRAMPTEAFEETASQRVPTVAAMDALVGSLAPDEQYVTAQTAVTPDSRRVTTRNFMPIPYKYLPSNFDREAPPKVWWTKLARAIKNDRLEAELAEVLDYLCVCLTKSIPHVDDEEEDDEDPHTLMGDRELVLPPLAEDRNLNRHHREILKQDLLDLFTTPRRSNLLNGSSKLRASVNRPAVTILLPLQW